LCVHEASVAAGSERGGERERREGEKVEREKERERGERRRERGGSTCPEDTHTHTERERERKERDERTCNTLESLDMSTHTHNTQ
jgi:hypothetical protein